METFFASLNPFGFAMLQFGLIAIAVGIGMFYFQSSICSNEEYFGDLPDFYTVDNTEVGQFYPIVIADKDNKKSIAQQFKVLDKRDENMLICIYETGDMKQGRVYLQGWVKEVNSQKWISPASL